MNFDDLKEQITEKLQEIWSTIKESPQFNTLSEKYHTLPSAAQMGVLVGGFLLVLIGLLSVPISFLSTASENISSFEDDRQMIRDLLKAGRQSPSPFMSQSKILSFSQLKTQVQSKVSTLRLKEEQRGSVEEMDLSQEAKGLAPPSISQFGAKVKLMSLNVKEIKDFGFDLQSLATNIKLIGIDITANAKNDHYFDVIYKFVSFSLDDSEEEQKKSNSKKGRGKKNKGRKKGEVRT